MFNLQRNHVSNALGEECDLGILRLSIRMCGYKCSGIGHFEPRSPDKCSVPSCMLADEINNTVSTFTPDGRGDPFVRRTQPSAG